MRLSTHGRYALRVMLDLTIHSSQRPVLRQEIAARQEISAEYIAQLFRHLCKDGLAQSIRGPGGGYILRQDASQISVGDVIRSTEGPIAVVACTLPGKENSCNRIDQCATRIIWVKLSNVIETFLDSISLKDIYDQARQINPQDTPHCPEFIDTVIDNLPSFQDDLCIKES
ncbi:MAG: RrF2 family transcriptional regulator [Chloroflexota bacterium]